VAVAAAAYAPTLTMASMTPSAKLPSNHVTPQAGEHLVATHEKGATSSILMMADNYNKLVRDVAQQVYKSNSHDVAESRRPPLFLVVFLSKTVKKE
jgi:hypothetical protein